MTRRLLVLSASVLLLGGCAEAADAPPPFDPVVEPPPAALIALEWEGSDVVIREIDTFGEAHELVRFAGEWMSLGYRMFPDRSGDRLLLGSSPASYVAQVGWVLVDLVAGTSEPITGMPNAIRSVVWRGNGAGAWLFTSPDLRTHGVYALEPDGSVRALAEDLAGTIRVDSERTLLSDGMGGSVWVSWDGASEPGPVMPASAVGVSADGVPFDPEALSLADPFCAALAGEEPFCVATPAEAQFFVREFVRGDGEVLARDHSSDTLYRLDPATHTAAATTIALTAEPLQVDESGELLLTGHEVVDLVSGEAFPTRDWFGTTNLRWRHPWR